MTRDTRYEVDHLMARPASVPNTVSGRSTSVARP